MGILIKIAHNSLCTVYLSLCLRHWLFYFKNIYKTKFRLIGAISCYHYINMHSHEETSTNPRHYFFCFVVLVIALSQVCVLTYILFWTTRTNPHNKVRNIFWEGLNSLNEDRPLPWERLPQLSWPTQSKWWNKW